MSLSEVDRLSAALLTLLGASDTTNSGNVVLTGRSSFSDQLKTRQHVPLSAAVSLPLSSTCSSTPWRRSSVVDSTPTTPSLPCLSRRRDDDHGRATPVSPRYKTELCRAYAEHGACRYGDKCQFAHGRDDLRSVVRHPKYKTDLCRTYHSTGLCPYGPRCHFIHNEDEARRQPTALPAADMDLTARELELRLALLNHHQRQKLASQSLSSGAMSSNSRLDRSAAATVVPAVVPQRHVPLDRRQSDPVTVFQMSRRLSPMTRVPSVALDSVGNSSPSSAADDDSPPPLSPTVTAADDACRHLLTSNDPLTALYVLAARLRLLQETTANR